MLGRDLRWRNIRLDGDLISHRGARPQAHLLPLLLLVLLPCPVVRLHGVELQLEFRTDLPRVSLILGEGTGG